MISDLGLDSWGGALSFLLTIASFALPVLISYNKRQKKKRAKAENLPRNFIVIEGQNKWQPALGKILKFTFASGQIVVTKGMMKEIAERGAATLVAIIEYEYREGDKVEAQVYLGDDHYLEGDSVNVKYNLLDKQQVVLG